jgi:membrane-bound lytic murein transglycosylase F
MPRRHIFAKERYIIFLLLFVQLALVCKLFWSMSPPGMIMPTIRVLAPESELVHTRLSPYGPGFERELVDLFAAESGLHPVWLHQDNPEAAWGELLARRADLLIGMGDMAHREIRPTHQGHVSAGPIYARHPVAVVHQRQYKALADVSELCNRKILVPDNALLQSVFLEFLDAQDCPTAAVYVEDGPLPLQFSAMQQADSRFTLVDSGRYRLWKPFFPEFQLSEYLEVTLDYRWFWKTQQHRLQSGLEAFWRDKRNSERLADLLDKYFGFFPDRIDRFELYHFVDMLKHELPRYSSIIAEAARRHEVDPLLLVALIYHESRFDTQAVSRTGVRGIMQITQATAQSLGMDDLDDPRQGILAGARYLRQLWERLDREGLTDWDRWLLALSAYNQGLGHTWDAMDLAKNLGLQETSWKNVKDVFPLLSQREYYSKSRHGYTRGREAVAHVESVRYYYYILHGLFSLGSNEGKHLGRLGLINRMS